MSKTPYTCQESAHPQSWSGQPRLSDDAATGQRWHAVYTLPRHEKSLARQLALREIDHFLPVYWAKRNWSDGSKVTIELPLFPSYIFVRVPRGSRGRVLESPGSLWMVAGVGKEPAEIPASLIESLRNGLTKDRAQPHPLLTVGQRVRVVCGAFAGMEGILQRLKSGFRVVITLELIMQSIAVEVEMSDIEVVN